MNCEFLLSIFRSTCANNELDRYPKGELKENIWKTKLGGHNAHGQTATTSIVH